VLERNRVYTGDARDLAGQLAPQSVSMVCTSPPYFGLRDYGTATWEGGDLACEHRTGNQVQDSKAPGAIKSGVRPGADHSRCRVCGAVRVDKQLGLEETPEAFVQNLVALFAALRPALHPTACMFINLGDSYGKGGQLLGMPWRFAFAMQDDGWILRSAITWCKRAPMPESVQNRPTSATEMVFLFAKQSRYYYDAAAIAEPASHTGGGTTVPHDGQKFPTRDVSAAEIRNMNGQGATTLRGKDAPTRNARNFWLLGPEPFPDAHFAVFPSEIPRRAIRAGSSERGVCAACGAPHRRVVERTVTGERKVCPGDDGQMDARRHLRWGKLSQETSTLHGQYLDKRTETTGWQPTCACDAGVRPALVLDPFLGSGTTAQVAVEEGRDWIGFDLDPRSVGWTAKRLARLPVRSLFAAGG
jgi:site-specific DNA-methyltransferase (cytosine-N4-specific)